jgi:glycosyltransferase involved in cell wall biosynthesis
MSREIDNLRPDRRERHRRLFQKYYPRNDGYIAISEGVAEDLVDLLGVTRDKIRIVYNPVVTPELRSKMAVPLDHPWLGADRELPVLLSIGRLEPQKDFPTLLRAHRAVCAQARCRLIILGEGHQREPLLQLARELGTAEFVQFPGYVANPFPYLCRADLFVLSSAWEGLGNVLIEALACGTPVVSTDCPSGPREILQDERYGQLVPVGDAAALGKAILTTLAAPLPAATLRQAVERFTVERCADHYLAALGLAGTEGR